MWGGNKEKPQAPPTKIPNKGLRNGKADLKRSLSRMFTKGVSEEVTFKLTHSGDWNSFWEERGGRAS